MLEGKETTKMDEEIIFTKFSLQQKQIDQKVIEKSSLSQFIIIYATKCMGNNIIKAVLFDMDSLYYCINKQKQFNKYLSIFIICKIKYKRNKTIQ